MNEDGRQYYMVIVSFQSIEADVEEAACGWSSKHGGGGVRSSCCCAKDSCELEVVGEFYARARWCYTHQLSKRLDCA